MGIYDDAITALETLKRFCDEVPSCHECPANRTCAGCLKYSVDTVALRMKEEIKENIQKGNCQ